MAADRSVLVRLRANVQEYNRNIGTATTATAALEGRLTGLDRQGGAAIDRLSGRLRLLADVAAILGPALVPIGAVAVPAMTGLAAQFGFAAVAAGGFIGSLQGVGGALEAVNKARLEPTAANLAAARHELERLSPAARDFVRQLADLGPQLRELRDAGAGSLLPGLGEALEDLETRAGDAQRILVNVNSVVADMLADGAESLASPRWDEFFTFLATDAPPAVAALGRSLGNVASAMADLWMAFDPLNDDFARWLVDSTAAVADWADGLDQTEGFQEFVAYVRENGPQVAETMGSVAMAVVRIAEAAAPLGGPVLQALEGIADAVAAIANSDAGPALMATVTSLALLNRGMSMFEATATSAWGRSMRGADGAIAQFSAVRTAALRGTSALAGLGVAATGAADGIGMTNTVSGALLGMLAGPWGAAVGGAVGMALDFADAQSKARIDVEGLTATLNQQTGALTAQSQVWAASELEAAGLLEKAEALGIGLSDVTNAALGHEGAMRRVTAQLQAAAEADTHWGEGMNGTTVPYLGDTANAAIDLANKLGIMGPQVRDAQESTRRVADAARDAGDGFRDASSGVESFVTSLARANRALEGRSNLRDYEQALDDFTASVKENGRSLDITTEKGRNNQAALDAIASSALTVAENLKGANRVRFLQQAREDFIDAADKLGIGAAAAQRLADKLGLVDRTKAKPEIDADTEPAKRKVNEVEGWLRGVNSRRATPTVDVNDRATSVIGQVIALLRQADGYTATSTITTHHITKRTVTTSPGFGPQPSADGSTVPKDGGPYADRYLYMLAPGEEVISNRHGQADRFRPLLKAINARRLAGGGTAGQDWPPSMAFGSGSMLGMQAVAMSPGDLTKQKEELIDRMIERLIRRFDGLGKAIQGTEKALNRQERAVDAAAEAVTRETGERDAVLGQMATLAQATTAGFRTGLFETQEIPAEVIPGDTNIWAAGARGPRTIPGRTTGGFFENLSADIAGLQHRAALQSQLALAGLDGAAFEAALAEAQGLEGNAKLQSLLDLGQVQQFEDMFNQRAALQAQVGGAAGDLRFGGELATANAELATANAIAERQERRLESVEEQLRLLNREEREREQQRERREERNADRTGEKVGEVINGAAAGAGRNNPRPRVGRP